MPTVEYQLQDRFFQQPNIEILFAAEDGQEHTGYVFLNGVSYGEADVFINSYRKTGAIDALSEEAQLANIDMLAFTYRAVARRMREIWDVGCIEDPAGLSV